MPLARLWEIAEPAEAALSALGDHVFVRIHDNQLTCREIQTGRIRWSRQLAFNPHWLGCRKDIVIVGYPQGIHCFDPVHGRSLWTWNPGSQPGRSLSGFALCGDRILCRQGEDRILALNGETSECVWSLWAPAARFGLPAPTGRFHPALSSNRSAMIAHALGGKSFLVDGQSGNRIAEIAKATGDRGKAVHWLPDGGVCISQSFESIVCLDARTGKSRWNYPIEFSSGLTGELPRFLCSNQNLFILVSRNYGQLLHRIDLQTGKPMWPEPILFGGAVDFDGASMDDTALYFMEGNRLQARAIEDGKLLWRRELGKPGSRWKMLVTAGGLVVSRIDQPKSSFEVNWYFGQGRTNLFAGQLADDGILLIDKSNGELLQKVNLPGAPPRVQVAGRFRPSRYFVPEVFFSRQTEISDRVQLAAGVLLILERDHIWGLASP